MNKSSLKYLIFGLFSMFCLGKVFAQAKHDYNWLLGYSPNQLSNYQGGSWLNFNETPVRINFVALPDVGFTCLTPYSDSIGNLVAYSSGCNMYQADHQIMPNGDHLNRGIQTEIFCQSQGYPFPESVFLPRPNTPGVVDYIHYSLGNQLYRDPEILYTTIDFNTGDGKGEVVAKNQPFLVTNDTIQEFITSVRHANGKDWWVVIPTAELDLISGVHIVKWTKDGPSATKYQELGPYAYATATQAAFSPDGTKYCFFASGLVVLADFDRSTGTLYNIRTWGLYDPSPLEAFGVAFSPNSRFLYLSTSVRIRQYDLQANDLGASAVIIGGIENSDTSLQYTCTRMQLAPDGQIYVTQYLDEKQLHRIAQPDRKGKDCEFIKFGLELPTRHLVGLPYFPNYNLGPLPPQDSLDCASGRFILQPNPVNQDLTILSLPCHETDWSIFNSLGQWQMDVSVTDLDKDTHLDVSRWQSGIYFLSGRSRSGKKLTYRFVVAH